MSVIGTLLALLLALTAPLGRSAAAEAAGTFGPGDAPNRGPVRVAALTAARAPVILVFGDSLSAGYGVPPGRGWVDLLAQKMARSGYDFDVVNASVSGETTAGGLARLPRSLDLHRPRILILELGANDGLRGLPVAGARANLEQMIVLAQARGATVLLLGIRMPPNYGERYTSAFQMIYTGLAREHDLALVPFLLSRVALSRSLMQADGLHPNERGQPLLLGTVWPKLQPLLPRRTAAPHGAHPSGAEQH